ncbi:hypothetical protein DXG01_013486 [Tephrocybe rancida]|nr:hypothetical protein DXG01_013486 [Tephrocybe rancida]
MHERTPSNASIAYPRLFDMHMQINVLFAILSSSLLSFASGAAVEVRSTLTVFSPHIISPDTTTTWVVGNVETVTWDPSDVPVDIPTLASVVLNSVATGPLETLSTGFDLRSGSVDVTVPAVTPGEYTITLFGDSGNRSPAFEIVSAY